MIDFVVVSVIVLTVFAGWQRGGALLAVGGVAFMIGALLGAVVASFLPQLVTIWGVLLGGTFALVPLALKSAVVAEYLDEHLAGRTAQINKIAGAIVSSIALVVVLWFVAAVALVVPSETPLLTAIRSSALLGSAIEVVPPQGSLGAVVLRSGVLPNLDGPLVLAEAPDPFTAQQPAVIAAANSVVQVRGSNCGGIATGSAWAISSDLLVTNAHVVAGERNVILAAGPRSHGVRANVVAFDTAHDIAVLELQGSTLAPLPIVIQSPHGTAAAIIGYPRGGDRRIEAVRIDRTSSFEMEPIGGGIPQPVPVTSFRGAVQPGNSGGPIVNEQGQVLGVVVSRALGQRFDAGFGVPASVVQTIVASASRARAVDTGRCLAPEELITEN